MCRVSGEAMFSRIRRSVEERCGAIANAVWRFWVRTARRWSRAYLSRRGSDYNVWSARSESCTATAAIRQSQHNPQAPKPHRSAVIRRDRRFTRSISGMAAVCSVIAFWPLAKAAASTPLGRARSLARRPIPEPMGKMRATTKARRAGQHRSHGGATLQLVGALQPASGLPPRRGSSPQAPCGHSAPFSGVIARGAFRPGERPFSSHRDRSRPGVLALPRRSAQRRCRSTGPLVRPPDRGCRPRRGLAVRRHRSALRPDRHA